MTTKKNQPETERGTEPCSTIHAALCACMAEVEAVGKNRKNKEQGYAYRGIDDLYNSLHPLFARHRLFVTCDTLDLQRAERTTARGTTLYLVYGRYRVTFHAEDGSSVSVECCGEAMDSGDKATNKASSAALKYALMQTLLIPTEDAKDSEVDTPEATLPTASADEVARCARAIREQGTEKPYQQLRAARSLSPQHNELLLDVLAELLTEAPADRPATLPKQKPAAAASRDAF